MKLARTKQLVFCNNKGGVGKTTLAFNCAATFANKGYKVVLVDFDPQSNLTLLTLGPSFYEDNLFSNIKSNRQKSVYNILNNKIEGSGDIDDDVPFLKTKIKNLTILPGDLRLSLFENQLITGYTEARAGERRGYSDTSALYRFLKRRGLDEKVDLFVIDTSPSLGVLNRVVFLGADFFVVPMSPDSFSVQGIENLGTIFYDWKKDWERTAKAVAGETPNDHVLSGNTIFLGYMINSFNIYRKKVVRRQRDWIERIPLKVKKYLSEKHSQNGLVESSWSIPLAKLQDMGQLTAISMQNNIPITDFTPQIVTELNLKGTKDVFKSTKKEFEKLADNILKRIIA